MKLMRDAIDTPMTGLDSAVWKKRLIELVEDLGEYRPLGNRHFSTFVRRSSTLLVTFETIQGIRALSENAQPFGFEMVREHGWSHLGLISNGDTWFRNPAVYDFFDAWIDDGTFDGFDRVLFYGAGPCGYAAAAYSVCAPGATVIAVQPQATLDPRMAEWDPRFAEMRRVSFTDRFGYAPDMLDAAERAFVLFDPREDLDAMHAALFARPHVTRLRMPFMGAALQTQLVEMDLLFPLLALAGNGKLSEATFYRLFRARRTNKTYLRNLLRRLDLDGRRGLARMLCSNVVGRLSAPNFKRRLDALETEARAGTERALA